MHWHETCSLHKLRNYCSLRNLYFTVVQNFHYNNLWTVLSRSGIELLMTITKKLYARWTNIGRQLGMKFYLHTYLRLMYYRDSRITHTKWRTIITLQSRINCMDAHWRTTCQYNHVLAARMHKFYSSVTYKSKVRTRLCTLECVRICTLVHIY